MPDTPPRADLGAWEAAARESLRGAPLESLNWHTPEGLQVKPLYTAADLAGLPDTDTLPGLEPFVRAFRWRSIWPPTADTTRIIRA